MSLPVIGTIRTFQDVQKAFERLRSYFASIESKNLIQAPIPAQQVTKIQSTVKDSNIAVFDGSSGTRLKDIGLSSVDLKNTVQQVISGVLGMNLVIGDTENIISQVAHVEVIIGGVTVKLAVIGVGPLIIDGGSTP